MRVLSRPKLKGGGNEREKNVRIFSAAIFRKARRCWQVFPKGTRGIAEGGSSQKKEVTEGGYPGERGIYARLSYGGRVHVEVGQGTEFNGHMTRQLDSLCAR